MPQTTHTSTTASSPLSEQGAAQGPAITLQEQPFRGHLNVRGQPGDPPFMQAMKSAVGVDLPLAPNTVANGRDLAVLWLGPDEWLLVTEPGAQAELETAINKQLGELFAGVTDVSSYYTTIEVAGYDAADLLARGTAVDLHPRVFNAGHCAQTLIAKTTATVVKTNEAPTFEIIIRVSFADYLWRWLKDAVQQL